MKLFGNFGLNGKTVGLNFYLIWKNYDPATSFPLIYSHLTTNSFIFMGQPPLKEHGSVYWTNENLR